MLSMGGRTQGSELFWKLILVGFYIIFYRWGGGGIPPLLDNVNWSSPQWSLCLTQSVTETLRSTLIVTHRGPGWWPCGRWGHASCWGGTAAVLSAVCPPSGPGTAGCSPPCQNKQHRVNKSTDCRYKQHRLTTAQTVHTDNTELTRVTHLDLMIQYYCDSFQKTRTSQLSYAQKINFLASVFNR